MSSLPYLVLISSVLTTVLVLFTISVHGNSLHRQGSVLSPYPELKYTIRKTWDNQSTPDNAEIHLSLQVVDEFYPYGRGLLIRFEAPFYNNPVISDTVPVDQPFLGLWNYEVFEAFFVGNDEEYLEIELGPKGHYVLFLFKDSTNLITYKMPLTNYTSGVSTVSSKWIGQAYIPGEYFPCNITKFNSFAIHNSEPNRVNMALYPVSQGEYESADFHRLHAFRPISLGVELNPKCIRPIIMGDGGSFAVPVEGGGSAGGSAIAVPVTSGQAVAVPIGSFHSYPNHPHHHVEGALLPVERVPEVVDSFTRL